MNELTNNLGNNNQSIVNDNCSNVGETKSKGSKKKKPDMRRVSEVKINDLLAFYC